jgi:hypothetical protein
LGTVRLYGASDFVTFHSAARMDEVAVKPDGECTPTRRRAALRPLPVRLARDNLAQEADHV